MAAFFAAELFAAKVEDFWTKVTTTRFSPGTPCLTKSYSPPPPITVFRPRSSSSYFFFALGSDKTSKAVCTLWNSASLPPLSGWATRTLRVAANVELAKVILRRRISPDREGLAKSFTGSSKFSRFPQQISLSQERRARCL